MVYAQPKIHAQETPRLRSGVWSNGGSIFSLLIGEDGRVRGAYQTAHGRPDPKDLFALTGFANGPLLGVVVAWRGFHSLTTWCGRHVVRDGREGLKMVWHYAREFADKANTEPVDEWATVVTQAGHYFFDRDLTAEDIALIEAKSAA